MLKDIILNARKTIPPPPVYFNELWGTGLQGGQGLGGYSIGTNDNLDRSSPAQVGTDTDWSYIASGRTSFAIKTSGSLWAWGDNTAGQLGNNATDANIRSSPVQLGVLTNWKKVVAEYTVVALKTDGTLWTWGRNNDGQLGLGDRVFRSSPTQVGNLSTWVSASESGITSHFIKKYT